MTNIFDVAPPAWLTRIAQPVDGKETGAFLGGVIAGGVNTLRNGGRLDENIGAVLTENERPGTMFSQRMAMEQLRLRRQALEVEAFRARAYEMAQRSQDMARAVKMEQTLQAMQFKQQLMEEEAADSEVYTQATMPLGSDPEKWYNATRPELKTLKYQTRWDSQASAMLRAKIQTDNNRDAAEFEKLFGEVVRVDKDGDSLQAKEAYKNGATGVGWDLLRKAATKYRVGEKEYAPPAPVVIENTIRELREAGDPASLAAAERLENINRTRGMFSSEVAPNYGAIVKKGDITDLYSEKRQIRSAILKGDVPKAMLPKYEARLAEIDKELATLETEKGTNAAPAAPVVPQPLAPTQKDRKLRYDPGTDTIK